VHDRCARVSQSPSSRGLCWLWGRRQLPIGYEIPLNDVVWTLGSVSAVHHRAFDAELLLRELPAPPLTTDSLITAARSLGFRVKRHATCRRELATLTLPVIALLRESAAAAEESPDNPTEPSGAPPETLARPALIVQVHDTHVMLFRAGTNQVLNLAVEAFDAEFTGTVFQFAPLADSRYCMNTMVAQKTSGSAAHVQGDWIAVGGGNNTIVGGDGNDLIDAGVGNDVIVMGPGRDTFVGGIEVTAADSPMSHFALRHAGTRRRRSVDQGVIALTGRINTDKIETPSSRVRSDSSRVEMV
jgi:hypothetical protein